MVSEQLKYYYNWPFIKVLYLTTRLTHTTCKLNLNISDYHILTIHSRPTQFSVKVRRCCILYSEYRFFNHSMISDGLAVRSIPQFNECEVCYMF